MYECLREEAWHFQTGIHGTAVFCRGFMERNFKLVISYDGTRYFGWEHQPDTDMTIQGKLENVLTRMCQEEREEAAPLDKVQVIGAGRTDAGVHARGMVASVKLDTDKAPEEILIYANKFLPEDISVNNVSVASDRFHARYNAIAKTYRYTLWSGAAKPVFDRKYVYVLNERPDIDEMRSAAEYLTGEHDFKSFCGNTHFKRSTVRKLDSLNIETSGNYIRLYFHGNGFLQNMVRIITGTLLEVGFGRIAASEMEGILKGRSRTLSGPTAPPQGLTLMKVEY